MFTTFTKLRLPVQIAIAVLVVGIAIGAYTFVPRVSRTAANSNVPVVSPIASLFSDKPINVCANTWGGFAGGQWFNGGFAATQESRFYKDYGLLVNFIVADDFDGSRAAWRGGSCDLLWTTVDAFVAEADGLGEFNPRLQFQVDWSRGGDLIVGTRDIQSINDLKGRKIAVAFGTPSHSFLLWMLKNSGMSPSDVEIVQVKGEPDAVSAFKARTVPAAIMWSPDDSDAIAAVPGAHVLVSTKDATDIIADSFIVKDSFAQKNHDRLVKLYQGWMRGNAAVNSDTKAFEEAVAITAAGYKMPGDFMRNAIRNTRLVTHGDNKNFFALNPGFSGMKGDELYTKTGNLYRDVKFVEKFPAWRNVIDTSVIAEAKGLDGPEQVAEATRAFTPASATVVAAPALSEKLVTVNFDVNSAVLTPRNQSIIDENVADTVKLFKDSYIRIEGNTDSTGDPAKNIQLSAERARSVADYLASTFKFSRERFITLGNGSKNPVCDEKNPTVPLDACRAQNRRTSFQVVR